MVSVGDIIETDEGYKGKVTYIFGNGDRFVICFSDGKENRYFIQGDTDFEVIGNDGK